MENITLISSIQNIQMSKTSPTTISELLSIPGNNTCADCHASNPKFVSTKFGIFLCQSCSKYHQTLDNDHDRIKSINDNSFTTYNLNLLKEVGNKNSNKYYEYSLPLNFKRPNQNNSNEMLEFIRNKYYRDKWTDKNKFRPTNFKFLNSEIVTEFRLLARAATKIFIFALFVILLILLLIFKRCGLIILVKLISIVLTIFFEIIELLLNYDNFYLLFGLFAEFIYGAISFGKYKSIIIIISAKFIRAGICDYSINWLFIFIAAALIYFGFGFWAFLSTIVSLALFIFVILNEPKTKN